MANGGSSNRFSLYLNLNAPTAVIAALVGGLVVGEGGARLPRVARRVRRGVAALAGGTGAALLALSARVQPAADTAEKGDDHVSP